jgi:hypothetical protein
MVTYNNTANYGPSQFIVSAVPGQGNYTTISSAITAAAAVGGPQTIIIQDGSYTENLNIPAGITLTSASGNCPQTAGTGMTGVTITSYTVIAGTSGEVRIVGCYLLTGNNGLFQFTATGASTNLTIENCFLNSSNVGLVTMVASPTINVINCQFNVTNGFIVASGVGADAVINFDSCQLISGSNSATMFLLTANTSINVNNCTGRCANTAGTGTVNINSATANFFASNFTVSAAGVFIAYTAAGSATLIDCVVNAAATNYVTGTGNLSFSNLSLPGTYTPVGTVTLTNLDQAVGQAMFPIGAGNTFLEGTNGTSGVVTLASGTATVSTTQILSTSRVIFTNQGKNASVSVGTPSLGTVTPGTSFVINSLSSTGIVNISDASTIYWQIVQTV